MCRDEVGWYLYYVTGDGVLLAKVGAVCDLRVLVPFRRENALSAHRFECEPHSSDAREQVHERKQRLFARWLRDRLGFPQVVQALDYRLARLPLPTFPALDGLGAVAGLRCEIGLRETE